MYNQLSFVSLKISSTLVENFLQGQIAADIKKITEVYQQTAICNLKGKVQYSFWIAKKDSNVYETIISEDCVDDFVNHIKKYGAFSQLTLTDYSRVDMVIVDDKATFTTNSTSVDIQTWLQHSIKNGQFVITAENSEKFQPQELRLHQLGEVGGVHYDKGCYIGQEPIARLWFKSKPKAWLHRVKVTDINQLIGDGVSRNIKVVNWVAKADYFEALVIAIPKALVEDSITVLELPEGLNGSVARNAE